MRPFGETQPSMAQARPAAVESRRRRAGLWPGPLVAGLCFGLAYGITQRLFALNVADWGQSGQGFDVQPFPGTSADSLKLRFGVPDADLRGDLERHELERQQADQDTPKTQQPAGADTPATDDLTAPAPMELPDPVDLGPPPRAVQGPLTAPPEPVPLAPAAGQP